MSIHPVLTPEIATPRQRQTQFLGSPSGCKLELVTETPIESALTSCQLLFVHGLWHGAWCWEKHFFDYFVDRGFPVAALSWRGHGNSSNSIPIDQRKRWNDYRVSDYLDDLNMALDHFADQQVVVIGHSMGGYLTQLALNKRNIRAAILMASLTPTGIIGPTLRFTRKYPLAVLNLLQTLSLEPVLNSREKVSDILFSGNADASVITEVFEELAPESFRVFLEMFVPWRIRRSRINTPVTVIASDNDSFISRTATEKMAAFYRTRAHFISGGGHDMMLDDAWRQTAKAIEQVLCNLAS